VQRSSRQHVCTTCGVASGTHSVHDRGGKARAPGNFRELPYGSRYLAVTVRQRVFLCSLNSEVLAAGSIVVGVPLAVAATSMPVFPISVSPSSDWHACSAWRGGFIEMKSKTLPTAGAGFDAGAAAEEAKRRAGQAKQAAVGWFGRARGVLTAVGREVTEVILPKTGARRP